MCVNSNRRHSGTGESRPQGRSSSSLEKRRGRPLKEDAGGPEAERDLGWEVWWLEEGVSWQEEMQLNFLSLG